MNANEQLNLQELELIKKTIRQSNQKAMRQFEETLDDTQLELYKAFVRERKIDTNTREIKQQHKQNFIKSLDLPTRHTYKKIGETSQLNKILLKLENILLVNDLLA